MAHLSMIVCACGVSGVAHNITVYVGPPNLLKEGHFFIRIQTVFWDSR
jgi:hypothetical protein